MVPDVARRGILLERHQQLIDDRSCCPLDLVDGRLQVWPRALDVPDPPVRPTGVAHRHLAGGRLALLDGAELDLARLDNHVAANVAVDVQLDLGRERLGQPDTQRGLLAPQEFPSVDGGDDVGRFVGFQRGGAELGRCAAAARLDRRDPHILKIDVLQGEAVLHLCAPGDHAKIVARVVEHRLGPVLGEAGRSRRQTQQQRQKTRSHGYLTCSPNRRTPIEPGRLMPRPNIRSLANLRPQSNGSFCAGSLGRVDPSG